MCKKASVVTDDLYSQQNSVNFFTINIYLHIYTTIYAFTELSIRFHYVQYTCKSEYRYAHTD